MEKQQYLKIRGFYIRMIVVSPIIFLGMGWLAKKASVKESEDLSFAIFAYAAMLFVSYCAYGLYHLYRIYKKRKK